MSQDIWYFMIVILFKRPEKYILFVIIFTLQQAISFRSPFWSGRRKKKMEDGKAQPLGVTIDEKAWDHKQEQRFPHEKAESCPVVGWSGRLRILSFCSVLSFKWVLEWASKTMKAAERMRRKEVVRNYIHLGPIIGKHHQQMRHTWLE